MSKKVLINLGLVVALVVVFGVSFIIGGTHTDPEERFGGTDGAATSQIEQSHPDYEPWFQPFFQPESSEVESGLFALQAGLGGVVLGFAIGGLWGRRHPKPASSDAPAPGAAPSGIDPAEDATPTEVDATTDADARA